MLMAVRSSAVSTFWPLPVFCAVHQRGHHAHGGEQRRAEIDIGRVGAGRHLAVAREVHGARHRLADRVEADARGVGAFRAEGRVGGKDDARVDRGDGVVVDAHLLEVFVGQVGDHHVGDGDQLLHHLAAGGLHRVQRHAELVAAHLEEHRAFAALGDRRDPAVLAALELLDADHLGAEVAQHGSAEGAGDVPAEIEDANSFQNARHETSPLK